VALNRSHSKGHVGFNESTVRCGSNTSSFRVEGGKVRIRRIFPIAERRGQSRLTEPLADAQFQQREHVFVPLTGHLLSARLGNVSILRSLTYGTPDRVLVDNLKPATRSFRYR
jgi:hypothetical protein